MHIWDNIHTLVNGKRMAIAYIPRTRSIPSQEFKMKRIETTTAPTSAPYFADESAPVNAMVRATGAALSITGAEDGRSLRRARRAARFARRSNR